MGSAGDQWREAPRDKESKPKGSNSTAVLTLTTVVVAGVTAAVYFDLPSSFAALLSSADHSQVEQAKEPAGKADEPDVKRRPNLRKRKIEKVAVRAEEVKWPKKADPMTQPRGNIPQQPANPPSNIQVGMSGRAVSEAIGQPAIKTTSVERGRTVEQYIYVDRRSQDTKVVVLRDDKVEAVQ